MKTRSKKIKILPSSDTEQTQDHFYTSEETNTQLSYTLSASFQPDSIICREREKKKIREFIKECLMANGENQSRVLYISGVPGVGKTIATSQIVKDFKRQTNRKKVKFTYLNALSLKQPKDIYKALNYEIFGKPQKPTRRRDHILELYEKLTSNQKIKVVVIDQVDFLMNKDQTIYYNLFEWSNLPQTRICFIIIANTMDFPERLMPKITSRMGNKRLVFKPYVQKQVQKIIQERLMKSSRFTQSAIVYACKKMSSFTSDVRKILNVLRISTLEEDLNIQIDVPVIVKNWRRVSNEEGEGWQEQLSENYKILLDAIKEKGGRAKDVELVAKFKFLHEFSIDEIRMMLEDLNEMNILDLKRVKYKGFAALEATLLKI